MAERRTDTFSRDSGVPLYFQAAHALRRFIEREGWVEGTRLPSLDVLAERFGIARLTMRQAVKKLEQEGVLRSRRGQGIVVLREPPRPPRMTVYADLDVLISKSRASSITELFSAEVTGCPLLAEAPQDARFRHWVRVHADGGVPYGFLDIYLHADVYALAPERFDRQPPMHVLRVLPQTSGLDLHQTLTIRPAPSEMARHLCLDPGAPVAHMLRVGTSAEGVVVFVAEVTYPGNQLLMDIRFRPGLLNELGESDDPAGQGTPTVS